MSFLHGQPVQYNLQLITQIAYVYMSFTQLVYNQVSIHHTLDFFFVFLYLEHQLFFTWLHVPILLTLFFGVCVYASF